MSDETRNLDVLKLSERFGESKTLPAIAAGLKCRRCGSRGGSVQIAAVSWKTIDRFGITDVEIYPVEEFTYLCPAEWRGSTVIDRRQAVAEYWIRCDPSYRDGFGAETFYEFIDRVDAVIDLVRNHEKRFSLVFTHEQFMKALAWRISSVVIQTRSNQTTEHGRFLSLREHVQDPQLWPHDLGFAL